MNHRLPKKLILAMSLALASYTPAVVAPANAAGWMEDYFNSAGAGMNITPAATYETQGQNVISGGGFSWRVPQKNTRFFSFSPPGYSAGCGGIDFWLGAYGFANMDQFVNALRNIGQNATGYFFKLALKSLAPEIDSTLEEIANVMNKMNQFGINSCQEMSKAYQNGVQAMQQAGTDRAARFGAAFGGFTDYFIGTDSTKASPSETKNQLTSTCNAKSYLCKDANGKITLPYGDFNVLYNALTGVDGGFSGSDIDLMISLLGTIVVRDPATSDTAAISEYYGPTLTWREFIGDRNSDTAVTPTLRQCGSLENCVYPGGSSTTTVMSSHKGFSFITKERLTLIYDSIKSRTALADSGALALLNMTSIPIYSMLSTAATAGGNEVLANQLIDLYSDLIAHELAYRYVLWANYEVNRMMNDFDTKVDKTMIDSLVNVRNTLNSVLADASSSHDKVQREVSARAAQIQTILHFQQAMNRSLGPNLVANLNFNRK